MSGRSRGSTISSWRRSIVLASEGVVHSDKSHGWHMAALADLRRRSKTTDGDAGIASFRSPTAAEKSATIAWWKR